MNSWNLLHLFLQSKPFQNVEFENFLGIITTAWNDFSDSIEHCFKLVIRIVWLNSHVKGYNILKWI